MSITALPLPPRGARPASIESSLSETNVAMSEVAFQLLNAIDPARFAERLQVAYAFGDDWATHATAHQRANGAKDVRMPFAAVSRLPDIAGVSQRYDEAWDDGYFSERGGPTQELVRAINFVPAALNYVLTIYDNRIEDAERYVDRLILDGFRRPFQVDYSSTFLGGLTRQIKFTPDVPRLSLVPSTGELARGLGPVFAVQVPILVDTEIARIEPARPILKIELKAFVVGPESVMTETHAQTVEAE